MKNIYKLIVIFLFFISNLFFSQYITGLSVTQNGSNQIKTKLKVYLPNVGEFVNSSTTINENVITLSTYYFMIGATAISNLENDFYIDIPNNGNYTLIVHQYVSGSEQMCGEEYCLEDTVTLNFSAPIDGTVSLNANEVQNNSSRITLFPVPTKEVLNIKTDIKIEKINIYDNAGNLILSNLKDSKLNISQLKNGMYYVEILSDKKKLHKKFIIQK